jgi:adenosine deaminase
VIDPAIPLIDLHRHLDGSIRLDTILDLARKHKIPLPADTLSELQPYVQITEPRPGVMAFIDKFKYMIGILADYDACQRVAFENVEDAYFEGIHYIELRFSPLFMAQPHGLDPDGVVEAVLTGLDQGRKKYDISVNAIGIISRTFGPDRGWQELESLLSFQEYITALDLAGDEINYPGKLFRAHFQEAREAGWNITIHAGEEDGPDSIWQAVEELGAERIGHGVSAVQDPLLMDYLVEEGIGVESNLTSNIQTKVVESYPSHPLREFLETGILATINTDDPGISAIDLKHEYHVAAPAAGLTQEQITRAQRNALKVAFLDEGQKNALNGKVSQGSRKNHE